MEIESEIGEISNFENLRFKRETKERESEMGEMKYQKRRASCVAIATCYAYDISNQISLISFGGQGTIRRCLLVLGAAWYHCLEQRRRDS